MRIEKFIQKDVLLPRLKQNGVLIVYDPDRRYQTLCLELASEKYRVINASESSITSRAIALQTLIDFGQPSTFIEGILVYVPAKAPLTDEEKQNDPFAIYGACGAVFPESDGDEYLSLCLKARADHATEIRRIFKENPTPSFEVIDAIGGGAGWPNLQALLKVESARDILFALLAPSEGQKQALKNQAAWVAESAALFQSTLGLNLKTKIKTWTSIADELWRFLLFSEFVFDLPNDLPYALSNVPHASKEALHLIQDLCDRLRNDQRTQAQYIERAEIIETELNLPALCEHIDDFGICDTFPFEERACFNQAVDALKLDNVDHLRRVLNRHEQSIWISKGENQMQWMLINSAASLVQACDDIERQFPDHTRSQDTLVDYYANSMREVDRLQREFEQAAGDFLDLGGTTIEVIRQSRATYRKLTDKVQAVFMRHLERYGWPILGRLSNVDVFDKFVAPKLLESGRRVAYFMIDAMRYELGVELAKQLDEVGQVEVQVACAQMPTVTQVGMATLLPGAGQDFMLLNKEDQVVPALADQSITSVAQRMDVLRKRYGQRFAEMELARFVRDNPKIESTVELLVIRSNDMDNDFESNPEAAPGLIIRTFQKIRSAIFKLRELGFQDAIIVTDHGFFLNTAIEPGDVCTKPNGKWINVHDRTLLGDGIEDLANLVLPAETLGIRGDFNQIAVPRALVSYRAGQWYFHGGMSLQEAVVPVISVHIRASKPGLGSKPSIALNYKRGSKKITTRLPVIEIESRASDLFAMETELIIEAYDAQGNVVGEAKPGGAVNPATRIITLKPGDTLPVTIKMDMQFEGKFIIKALDPITQAGLGNPLDLETDYTV